MPLRFRPSVRLGRGTRLILGKTPTLVMRSGRFTTSVGSRGVRRSVRLGRGLSYGCALPLVALATAFVLAVKG